MADYKKEWFAKSQVDYFSSFISLWLSCNSWYNFHYSLNNDREHVNRVKADATNTNKLYKEFQRLFTGPRTKEQLGLFSNIELLNYSLNRRPIQAKNLIGNLGLGNVLVDFSQKSDPAAYTSLTIRNAKTVTGKLKANVNGVDLGEIVLINESQKVFAGLFEIIYQIRCMLVHGEFEPTDDYHEIIKYCYLILFDLMKPFCG